MAVAEVQWHTATSDFWTVEEALTKIVPTLAAERRLRVLMSLRPDSWNDDLVKLLVGDDDAIYGKLLDAEDLASFHLAPLVGKPDEKGWRAKSTLGSRQGHRDRRDSQGDPWNVTRLGLVSRVRCGQGGGGRSKGCLTIPDRRISRIGERGAESVKEHESRALTRERHMAVHGR